jgi:hypothetical protein
MVKSCEDFALPVRGDLPIRSAISDDEFHKAKGKEGPGRLPCSRPGPRPDFSGPSPNQSRPVKYLYLVTRDGKRQPGRLTRCVPQFLVDTGAASRTERSSAIYALRPWNMDRPSSMTSARS